LGPTNIDIPRKVARVRSRAARTERQLRVYRVLHALIGYVTEASVQGVARVWMTRESMCDMGDRRAEPAAEPDAAVDTSATPPGATPRWRRIVAVTLLVLGVVLVPVSLSAVWVHNILLNTDNYVATVGPLAGNSDLQHGVADRVATALFASGTVEKRIAAALPSRAEVLAGPIASGLQSVTNTVALKVVQSDQFHSLWENVNRRAHDAVVKVLTGGGSRVSTKNGAVAVNLQQIFSNVKRRLDGQGITLLDSVQLPTKYRSYVIFQSQTLEQVQGAVDVLQTLAWVLPVLVLICIGGAIALSSNRRRTIQRAGIAVAVAVGIQGALLSVGRNYYLDAITAAGARRGSAGAVWDQLTSFLRLSGRTVIVLALLAAVAAWVAGPSRHAARIRNLWNRGLRRVGTRADESHFATGGIADFVARYKGSLRLTGVGIAIAILILWDHPKPRTVLGVGILLLIYLAVIEFLSRVPKVGSFGIESAVVATPDDQDPELARISWKSVKDG
jgi:hypothetical protein